MRSLGVIFVPLLFSVLFSHSAVAARLTKDIGYAPLSLSPTYGTTAGDVFAIIDLFEGLFSFDRQGELILAQAQSYTISEDGLTYTFRLRDDIRWSDGVPVTAYDYVAGVKYIVTPQFNQFPKPFNTIQFLENAEAVLAGELPFEAIGVKAVDERTLVYKLRSAIEFFPTILTWNPYFPVPRHVIDKRGELWFTLDNIVTNAAYVPVKKTAHGYIYERSDTYWDLENVTFEEVEIYVKDAQQKYETLIADGTLDIISYYYGTESTRWFSSILGLNVNFAPLKFVSYVALNQDIPALQDQRVRKALSLAFFKEELTNRLFEQDAPLDYASVMYSFAPPSSLANWTPFEPDWSQWSDEKKLETARSLMAEAGYGPDNPLRLTYSYWNDLQWERLANALVLAWERIDVKLELLSKSGEQHYQDMNLGNFEIAQATWGSGYDDPSAALYILQSNHVKNYGRWKCSQYDSLFRQLIDESLPQKRLQYIRMLEELILEEVPIIPFASIRTLQIYTKDVDIGLPNFNHVVLSKNVKPVL